MKAKPGLDSIRGALTSKASCSTAPFTLHRRGDCSEWGGLSNAQGHGSSYHIYRQAEKGSPKQKIDQEHIRVSAAMGMKVTKSWTYDLID
jgi:hypothetical protein